MERNRRIAKAYARCPVIRIDSRCSGFNGDSIGLAGFENPFRDEESMSVHRKIGAGIIVAADEDGNIMLHTLGHHNVSAVTLGSATGDATCSHRMLDRTCKIFDMRAFVASLNHELSSNCPRIQWLQNRCFTALVFSPNPMLQVIDSPVWIIIINIVALEMLHRNLQLRE